MKQVPSFSLPKYHIETYLKIWVRVLLYGTYVRFVHKTKHGNMRVMAQKREINEGNLAQSLSQE